MRARLFGSDARRGEILVAQAFTAATGTGRLVDGWRPKELIGSKLRLGGNQICMMKSTVDLLDRAVDVRGFLLELFAG